MHTIKTVEEVADKIGADWLIFQDLEDLVESVRIGNPKLKHFDASVFDGKYITGDIDQVYLDQLGQRRNDEAKRCSENGDSDKEDLGAALIGMHNAN